MLHHRLEYLTRTPHSLIAVLLIGLCHGLLYICLVPPWQHYDEPNHFEYVWLLANRPGMPKPGDYDQTMRKAVASSMKEHGFFRGMSFRPDLDAPSDEPIWIGQYQQLGEPPLYYLIASLPLRLFDFDETDQELYATRLISLMLFLFTLWMVWGATSELVRDGHPLRLLLPLSVAMLPGFTDLMTSVNSDVAAVALFSSFCWGGLRLIRRGVSLADLLWTTTTAALAYWTKSTVYIAIPLFVVVLLLAIFRTGKWRMLAWGIMGMAVLSIVLVMFDWGDAANWDRTTRQESTTRASESSILEGAHVFRLELLPNVSPGIQQLRQIVPPKIVRALQEKTVTLGGWIWASVPMTLRSPMLIAASGIVLPPQDLQVGEQPVFFAIQGKVTTLTDRAWIALSPIKKAVETPVTVYYDGIVLAEGEFPLDEAPQFDSADAVSGFWGDKPFVNLLRNGSAERAWFKVKPWADALVAKYFPDRGRPSQILYTLFDLNATGWYYRTTAKNLVRTFWAKFGWGHVPLLGHKPYRPLAAVTVLGLLGASVALWKRRRTVPWDALIILGVALMVIWGLTWVRGSIYLYHWIYIPGARYAYPAIFPTMLVLNAGWYEITEWIRRFLKTPFWVSPFVIYLTLLFTLDLLSILSIVQYYYVT